MAEPRPLEIVADLQGDGVHGITVVEAARRLALFGANRLGPRKGRSALVSLLLQIHQPLIYILLAASLTTLLQGAHVDAGVILGVVLVLHSRHLRPRSRHRGGDRRAHRSRPHL